MLRKKVYAFLGVSACGLLLLPVFNFTQLGTLTFSELNRVDTVLPWVGRPFYDITVSMAPSQTVIGKEGWFFLGDKYLHSFTKKQRLLAYDKHAIDTVIANSRLWDVWFKQQGVKAYRILLAPDKDSVYPEYLPDWAAPVAPSPLDYFEQQGVDSPYVHLGFALKQAKADYDLPLYHRTDSHWNRLGAWVAFRFFSLQMQGIAPELRWPKPDEVENEIYIDPHEGLEGDLARFQYVEKIESSPFIRFAHLDQSPIIAQKINLDTGAVISSGEQGYEDALLEPVLFTNAHALNQAKVLWVHDSFGTNMVPWMLASFSEVIQIHSGAATAERIEQITLEHKPDYIFTTVVERESRYHFYLSTPPSTPAINGHD